MSNKYHHIAIALAGVAQSSLLIPQIANTGVCSSSLYEQSIKSIFNTSPKTTEDVYGGIGNLKTGLETLVQLLSSGSKEQVEIIRYVFGTLGITSKLLKNSDSLNKIDQRLTRISGLYADTSLETIQTHIDDLSYFLAGIYSDIISPLTSKIKVTGKADFLQNSLVQAKVRTALLGSVRSAMLWYQVGGSRLQLVFSRKQISHAAKDLLRAIDTAN